MTNDRVTVAGAVRSAGDVQPGQLIQWAEHWIEVVDTRRVKYGQKRPAKYLTCIVPDGSTKRLHYYDDERIAVR